MKTSLGARPLLYPTPVLIVGTYDAQRKPNVMAVAWGGICCSKPPCVAVSLRAATYTHGSLMERKAFTVSVPSRDHVEAADYFGLVSGRDADKFAVTGLTPVASDLVDAPYVGEFPLVLECKVVHIAELGLHTLFVGEIVDVKIEEDCLDAGGKPAADLLKPFCWTPGDNEYRALGETLGRGFSVGKPLQSSPE